MVSLLLRLLILKWPDKERDPIEASGLLLGWLVSWKLSGWSFLVDAFDKQPNNQATNGYSVTLKRTKEEDCG